MIIVFNFKDKYKVNLDEKNSTLVMIKSSTIVAKSAS